MYSENLLSALLNLEGADIPFVHLSFYRSLTVCNSSTEFSTLLHCICNVTADEDCSIPRYYTCLNQSELQHYLHRSWSHHIFVNVMNGSWSTVASRCEYVFEFNQGWPI